MAEEGSSELLLERIDSCPLCGTNRFAKLIECRDHLVSGEVFGIEQCESCGLKMTNPRPLSDHLSRYYQSQDYIAHTDQGNNLVNRLYKIVRFFTLRTKRRLIERFADIGSILDIGCGTGAFLRVCRQGGWEIAGVEPDENARQRAAALNGTVIYADLQDLDAGRPAYRTGRRFQAITLWHVLEHLPDLHGSLAAIKERLAEKGLLLIAAPNVESYDCRYFKEFWAAYDVPRHLYHFSAATMRRLVEKHQLAVERILPIWLDAFYISLLSTKYRDGKSGYLTSVGAGLRSNASTWTRQNNYSSLIYLIRHAKRETP